MNSQQQIGKNIFKARKDSNLTQAEVATMAGINVNYFARIERGEVNPTIEILEAISRALKVKSSEILPF